MKTTLTKFVVSILLMGGGLSYADELSETLTNTPNTPSDIQTYQLEPTVISATGYEQQVKYAPASISIIPKEEITNRPIKDLGDIVQDIPGVSVDVFKTGVSTIAIRGMHPEYTLILVDGKRISPSKGIDDNYYNSSAGSIPLISMIERVEVIRGPASLMYGSEAMGGVINIITKKMPDKTTASISLETRLQEHHSTWGNTYGFNGSIFHPINEQFSINLRGKINYGEKNHIRWKGASGYICTPTSRNSQCANPYAMQSPSDYNNANIGARLNFVADESNSFYLDTDFNFQRIGTLNSSPAQIGEYRDYERFNVLLNHDGDYSFGKFNTYAQFNSVSRITHHYIYYGANETNNYKHGRNHQTLIYNPNISLASTFTTNFDFGNAGALILNAGPSFIHERLVERETGDSLTGYQVAIFGEGEYLPTEWFGLTAGTRVNFAKIYGAYAAPRAYLNFYPTSWLTFKAGFASGFQMPDLAVRFDGYYDYGDITGVYYYGNKDLKLEKTYNYEVAAMVDSPFANFSLTGYITDYTDAISSKSYTAGEVMLDTTCKADTGETCTSYINVGKARLYGAEFAVNSKALFSSLYTKWGIFC